MANESRVVVQAFAPRIVAQSDAQELNFDDLIPQTKQIFRNLFTPIAGTDAEMILSLQHTGEKGISLKTRQTTLLTKPVLYITSWYRETNPETGLLETVHDNILKMGVIESTNNNENTVTKFTYIKSYGTLNMSNNPIENLPTPVNDTDAVNKSYVDTSINNIDYSSFVTNTGLSSTLNDYITNTSLATTLNDYITNTSLATTLTDYPTNTSLATTLTDYPTNTSLATTLTALDNRLSEFGTSFTVKTGGNGVYRPITAPLIVNGTEITTFNNPVVLADLMSNVLLIYPNDQEPYLYATNDGTYFKIIDLRQVFGLTATSYNLSGWFEYQTHTWNLVDSQNQGQLVMTTDFKTYTEKPSASHVISFSGFMGKRMKWYPLTHRYSNNRVVLWEIIGYSEPLQYVYNGSNNFLYGSLNITRNNNLPSSWDIANSTYIYSPYGTSLAILDKTNNNAKLLANESSTTAIYDYSSSAHTAIMQAISSDYYVLIGTANADATKNAFKVLSSGSQNMMNITAPVNGPLNFVWVTPKNIMGGRVESDYVYFYVPNMFKQYQMQYWTCKVSQLANAPQQNVDIHWFNSNSVGFSPVENKLLFNI